MMCAIQTQAEAVCGLFDGKKEEIKVIGIRYDEKMYEILLINKKCAKVVYCTTFAISAEVVLVGKDEPHSSIEIRFHILG